jgi:UDP-N-acetylmuramoyl-tripeptide--D-alanyl-D-alanine ligase
LKVNHKKEIEFLCDVASPDYGYITNFGKAHLEGFMELKELSKEKRNVYKFEITRCWFCK